MLSLRFPLLDGSDCWLCAGVEVWFQVWRSSRAWLSFSTQSSLSCLVSAENQHLNNNNIVCQYEWSQEHCHSMRGPPKMPLFMFTQAKVTVHFTPCKNLENKFWMENLEVRCKAPSTDVTEVIALLLNENKNNFYSILTSSRKNEIHSFIIYCIFQSYIFQEILFPKVDP